MINGSRRWLVTGALVLAGTILVGCSNSAGKPTASSPGTASSEVSTSAAPAGGGAANSGSAADAATTKSVTTAYQTFFNSKTTPVQSEAALQHGAAFRQTLVDQAKSTVAQQASVTVSAVRTLRADVAAVTFTLKNNGAALLPNAAGFAVREGGSWKVAAQTFCGLLKLEGAKAAECSDTSVTALPS
jgi:hypothetical protein